MATTGNAYIKKILITLSVILIISGKSVSAQNDLDVVKNNWLLYSDASNSLYHHLSDQAYILLARRESEIKGISSLAGWQERQKEIRETLLDIVGPFPEKTPLNAKIIRTINKEKFRVEHIIFESQPGFLLHPPCSYLRALKKRKKAPAIIYCSGHSDDGYRSEVINM